jgi:hypothetical protein
MPQKMTWEEIKKHYPKKYVLLRNYLQEESCKDKVKIIDGEVIFSSTDSKEVYHQYNEHKNNENVIFAYTGWDVFEVEKRPFLGVRFSHA